MERRFYAELVGEELLASGDATHPSANLQVTQSVMGLMEDSIMEEASDDDDSSTYDELSSTDSTDQPLSLCPTAFKERLPYPYPSPYNIPADQSPFKFGAVGASKKLPNPRVSYVRSSYRNSSGSKYKAVKSSAANKPRPVGLQRSRSNSCVDGRATLSLGEISKLLSCAVCKAVPITSLTVHCCANGHQACGNCFSTGYRKCRECRRPLEGRNEVLEKVLQRLRQVCPGLFPHEGPIKLNSELQRKLDEAEKADNSKMLDRMKLVQHSTHRPLDCPHLSCRRVIAANGFLAHFQFEHSSVPVFEMSPDCAHQFGLSHRCFENRYPRAIAIIEVNLAKEKCGAVRKLSCMTEPEKKATFLMRRDAVLCVLLGAALTIENTVFLLAWCACLHEEETPLTFCLRATSTSGSETCYNGPASSLHSSQDPASILREAQGLVLSSGVFGKDKACPLSKQSITFDLQFNLK